MLRVRERLGISEAEFLAANVDQQLTWIGYELLRELEETGVT